MILRGINISDISLLLDIIKSMSITMIPILLMCTVIAFIDVISINYLGIFGILIIILMFVIGLFFIIFWMQYSKRWAHEVLK